MTKAFLFLFVKITESAYKGRGLAEPLEHSFCS